MNGLRERFEEMAGTPAPPSRLTADGVYHESRRRRQRRLASVAAALLCVVGLGVGVGVAVLTATGDDTAAPKPDPTADGWPAGTRHGSVIAAVADAEHIYATVTSCFEDGTGARHCTGTLMGSDDGGRSWTLRQPEFGSLRLSVPAPGVLLTQVENGASRGNGTRISTDGGRTWADLVESTEPVAEVPAGGWLDCLFSGSLSCILAAVDPATLRVAPLATQPPVQNARIVGAPASAGFWIAGFDPTGPAVAVSRDRGRSWERRVLGVGEADFVPTVMLGSVAVSSDGGVAYALLTGRDEHGAPRSIVYATTDGAVTWRRTDPGPATAGQNLYSASTYVAADGTHRLSTNGRQWYVGGAGRPAYAVETPEGLAQLGDRSWGGIPLVANPASGVYLAFDTEAVYRSGDGIRWTRHPVQAPPR